MALVLLALGTACERPVVSTPGKPTTVGGMSFTVGDYETRYLELSEGDKVWEYARPVLVVPVTVTNVGEGEFVYNPTHATQQMTEAATPLLYQDPGPEAELPPESKTPINGVYLERGALPGQITEPTTLQKGQELTDLFLFEVPDEGMESLILSLPPSMHRGKMPVLFRVPYTPQTPEGPKVHTVGQPVAFDGLSFEVKGAEVEYVKTDDTAQGPGYSSAPLLKVRYAVTNKGEAPVEFDPGHRAMGGRGASLYGKEGTFKRARFSGTTSVEGQVDGSKTLAPGETVEDFVLFERPGKTVEVVTFEYPASLFGAEGIARVTIPYQYAEPELPKELQKAAAPEVKSPSDDG